MKLQKPHGKAYVERVPGCGWVLSCIWVDPGFRERGIGSSLMTEVLKKCGRPIFLFATPELGADLKRLKKFYQRFGFVPFKDTHGDLYPYRFNMILEKYDG